MRLAFFHFVVLCIFLDRVAAKELKLILLHNNDMHSRFEETAKNSGTCKASDKNVSCYGGFARTAHVIRSHRKMAESGAIPDVLYLNAGDTYTGTTWFGVHKWKIAADFMNLLAPDAMCLGNHEFDNGPAGLAPFLQAAKFPVLAANINASQTEGLDLVKPSAIIEIRATKIGIVGYLTPDTISISSTGNVQFHPEVASLRAETERLDKEGVKIIVALGHSGYLMDQTIARDVPLVDVVIGGHSNTFLYNGAQPDAEEPEDPYPKVVEQKSGKKVPVVQAYAYTKYLGVLNVTFDENGDLIDFQGQPILLTAAIPQDSEVLERLEAYRKEVDELDVKVVGRTKVLLEGTLCRVAECSLGNLIADSFVSYMASLSTSNQTWTNAPLAILNGGGVRNSIDPATRGGNITRGDILAVMPFDSRVLTMQLMGWELLETLELGARSNGETSRGEFLQVSGVKYSVDFGRPAMSRVFSVRVRCGDCLVPQYRDLDPLANYTVVATSFVAEGGDGFYILKDKAKTYQDLNDVDVLQWYLEREAMVYTGLEDRIIVFNSNATVDSASSANCLYGHFFILTVGSLWLFML